MDLMLSFGGFDLKVATAFAQTVRRLAQDVLVPRNREYLRYRKAGRLPYIGQDGLLHVVRVAPLPHLYAAGVIYAEDPPGVVSLADIPTVLARGWGHCFHLSAWLCADLLEAGYGAAIRIKWAPRSLNQGRLYHVQVRLAPRHGYGPQGLGQVNDKTNHLGQILDPSRMLGMGSKPRLIGNLQAGTYPSPQVGFSYPRLSEVAA